MTGQSQPFQLTFGDMQSAAWLYARAGLTRPGPWLAWAVLWAGFVVFLVWVGGGIEQAQADWLTLLGISLLPFALVIVLSLVMTPIMVRRNFGKQKSLHEEVTLFWSDAGFAVQSSYGRFQIPWDHFLRWAENDKLFLLLESDRLYRPVPKRVLSPQQQAELRTYLARIGA